MKRHQEFRNNKPFSPVINICRYLPSAKPEGFGDLPRERQDAWHFREKADSLDGWCSIAIEVSLPPQLNVEDFWDAFSFGVAAMQNYLADLAAERNVK